MATRNSRHTWFIHDSEVGKRPSTNPKCPPLEVVTRRVCGLLENPSRGRDEAGTNGSSVAERQRNGVAILWILFQLLAAS
jgi:hypothetical protein